MPTKSQRQRIAKEANFRCGYCLLQEVVSGVPLTLEHLLPKVRGGKDKDANLWLSCRLCNEHKSTVVEAIDPDTGELVPLFHPRTDSWSDQGAWSQDGTRMLGKTSIGRATISVNLRIDIVILSGSMRRIPALAAQILRQKAASE